MRVDDVCAFFDDGRFPRLDVKEHPDREAVLDARGLISTAVSDFDFLGDCLELELDLIESDIVRRGLVPFLTIPDFGVRLALGYWSPGSTPGPHEHTAWTVTAVVHNELEVRTFDRDQSYSRGELVDKKRFLAPAGRVGYIYEPCIHQPTNISSDWSLSLHVSSPRDGEPVDSEANWEPTDDVVEPATGFVHPYQNVVKNRRRQAQVRELSRFIAQAPFNNRANLLARCRHLATGSGQSRREHRRFDDRMAEPWVLTKVHEGLNLSWRCADDMVTLVAETDAGLREELSVSAFAKDAIAHVTKHGSFEVAALPGGLSGEECVLLGRMLEEAGLFSSRKS